MRRMQIIAAAIAVLLLSAGPAAGVKPDRAPAEWTPLSFGAGDVCDFAVEVSVPTHNQMMTTFYDRDGNPRATVITGRSTMLAVSEFGEFSIQGGGRSVLGGDADTFVLDGTGINALYFFDGDATPDGSGEGGLFVIKGTFHEELDLNTNVVTEFEYQGTAIDVCAALAPD